MGKNTKQQRCRSVYIEGSVQDYPIQQISCASVGYTYRYRREIPDYNANFLPAWRNSNLVFGIVNDPRSKQSWFVQCMCVNYIYCDLCMTLNTLESVNKRRTIAQIWAHISILFVFISTCIYRHKPEYPYFIELPGWWCQYRGWDLRSITSVGRPISVYHNLSILQHLNNNIELFIDHSDKMQMLAFSCETHVTDIIDKIINHQ